MQKSKSKDVAVVADLSTLHANLKKARREIALARANVAKADKAFNAASEKMRHSLKALQSATEAILIGDA